MSVILVILTTKSQAQRDMRKLMGSLEYHFRFKNVKAPRAKASTPVCSVG
jgi:hypothetical protein